jgi:LemA protein
MNKNLAIALTVLVVIGGWFAMTYNRLVGLREGVNGAWSQVQNVYQRRADLVPNLVETVKGAANFEKSTLTAVTEARAKVGSFTVDKSVLNDPQRFHQFEQAQGGLGQALGRLMVVIEKYPELKANQNFRDLQVQLEGTENRITVERREFNVAAQTYNTAIKMIPGSMVARLGGFQERPYFEAEAAAQHAPQVKF